MEVILTVFAVLIGLLTDHAMRADRRLRSFQSEMEKHWANIAAQRAAYNALFEEVRELKRKTNNE